MPATSAAPQRPAAPRVPDRRRVRRDALLLGLALVLLLPEVLLTRHTIGGSRNEGISLTSEALTIPAGALAGIACAGLVLHTGRRRRSTIVLATVVSLLVLVGALVISNVAPPPFVTAYPPAGVPTLNGVLNAVYVGLLVGGGTAALRFTAAYFRAPRG